MLSKSLSLCEQVSTRAKWQKVSSTGKVFMYIPLLKIATRVGSRTASVQAWVCVCLEALVRFTRVNGVMINPRAAGCSSPYQMKLSKRASTASQYRMVKSRCSSRMVIFTRVRCLHRVVLAMVTCTTLVVMSTKESGHKTRVVAAEEFCNETEES